MVLNHNFRGSTWVGSGLPYWKVFILLSLSPGSGDGLESYRPGVNTISSSRLFCKELILYIYIYIRPGYDVKRPRQRACVSATGFMCQRLLLMWVGLLFVFVFISACYLVVCYVIYYIVYHYITVIYYFLFLFVQTYQKWTHTSSFWESTFALSQCVV